MSISRIFEQTINNKVFRLLFDPRGVISRQEYWTGLILIWMILILSSAVSTWSSVVGNLIYSNYDIVTYSISATFFASLSFYIVPAIFIVFYSSFVLTLKRTRTTALQPIAWLLALLTSFLFLSCNGLAIATMMIANYNSIPEASSIFDDAVTIYSTLFVAGIISIVLTSIINPQREDKTTGIETSTLFVYFYLLLNITLMITLYLAIHFQLINIHKPDFLIFFGALYIIVFTILIIIKSIDAGINLIIPIVLVIFTVTMPYVLYHLFIDDLPKPTIGILLLKLLEAVYNIVLILFFVLIALPSKKQKNDKLESGEWDKSIENRI